MNDGTSFAARYYDGKSARSQDVTLTLSSGGISIRGADGSELGTWPSDRIVFAEKPRRNEPLRVGLQGTTARLVIDHSGASAAILGIAPKANRTIRTSGKAVAKVAVWVAGAVASAAVIVLVLIPLLSAQLARQTPDSIKARIGGAAMSEIVKLIAYMPGENKRARYCHDEAGLAALGKLTSRILDGMENPPGVRIFAIDAKLVNAFALPGGYIVVTSGLIGAAASAEEVAGVVGHEIGHTYHRHPTQAIYRTTAVSLLISAIIGDFSGGILVTGIAEWALNSSYSRDAERETDSFAIERLNAANIDGTGLLRFFETLDETTENQSEQNGVIDLLSTHPRTEDRIAYIRSATRGSGNALTPAEWDALKKVCTVTAAMPLAAPVTRISR